jgi:drug/metabolite transporter (DMT)-like permease
MARGRRVASNAVLFATLLALASAGLHATWNLVVKASADRELAAWGQWIAGALLFLPVLIVAGFPERDAWPYLAASSLVHVVYVYALVAAYTHGDFSLAYPLARGGGALVAAVLGAWLLADDALPLGAWIALLVVAGGLASLVRPGAPRAELGFALLTAVMIGAYTVIDTAGARRSGTGFAYGCALVLCSGVTVSITALARRRGPALVASVPSNWRTYLGAGFCLTVAYSLVMVAVRHAPVGYVATLRESSVVIGALMGWLVLHEPLGRRRLVSSFVVLVGLVALIAFR